MKIALDFDGVLSHTMKRWVAVFNLHYKDKYEIDELTIREIDRWAFFEKFNMPVDEAFEIFDKCWTNWEKLEPLEQDIYQKTKMLSNLAHGELDIVTTVSEDKIPFITRWLLRHDIVYRKVIHSKEKHKLDYDVYIDDSPKNVTEMYDAGKVVLMYNQPWNRHIDDIKMKEAFSGRLLMRVYNLYHAIDVIRSLERAGRFD